MITKDLDSLSLWSNEFHLPLVTDDSELFEYQILLGGISLVLSRLHPKQGKNRFTYTRGLAMKLVRLLEESDIQQFRPNSVHLRESLAECERALDTGTLIVFRRMQLQALKDEQANAARAQNDSKFGASIAGGLDSGPIGMGAQEQFG